MPSPPNKHIKHRRAIKKFFITFPKSSGLSKEQFYNDISEHFPTSSAICVEEQHKDGSPHLHLAIEFENFVTKYQLLQLLKTSYEFDFQRIDVQSMKSMKHSISYLTQPDKDKIVDLHPFLFNIKLEQSENATHQLFAQQFSDDHPISWAINCYCHLCQTLLQLHSSELRSDLRKMLIEEPSSFS